MKKFWVKIINRSRFEAFTLLEILVVLTIIGILLAVMLPNYTKVQDSAMKKAALTEMKGFNIAIYNYKMDNGASPGNVDDLIKGGYIPKDMGSDPWNHKYRLDFDPATGNYKILSAGPDGKMETKDDLSFEGNL